MRIALALGSSLLLLARLPIASAGGVPSVAEALSPSSGTPVPTDFMGVLALTYETNPQLAAARASLRATDEVVAQAKQYWWRPQVRAGGQGEFQHVDQSDTTTTNSGTQNQGVQEDIGTGNLAATAEVYLYRGGQTLAEIRAARAEVAAAEATLNQSEQTILADAASAYAEVVYYRGIVKVSREEADGYEPLREMTESMYRSRTSTLTDLAQVDLELSTSLADLSAAQASEQSAEGTFAGFVGVWPGALDDPPSLAPTVATLDEALAIAGERSPKIAAARQAVAQNEYLVRLYKGTLLPQLAVTGSYGRTYNRLRYIDATNTRTSETEDEGSVFLAMTVPIFSGGVNYSRVRQYRQQTVVSWNALRNEQLDVLSDVRALWQQRSAYQQQIEHAKRAVAAGRQAVKGQTVEYRNGTSSMQDLLITREDLYDAMETLLEARYSLIVAEISLREAMGTFDARSLGLDVEHYDPKRYLDEIENRWIGYGIE